MLCCAVLYCELAELCELCELSELSELSGLDEMSERVSECLSPWRFRLAAALASTTFFLRAALPFLGGIAWQHSKV